MRADPFTPIEIAVISCFRTGCTQVPFNSNVGIKVRIHLRQDFRAAAGAVKVYIPSDASGIAGIQRDGLKINTMNDHRLWDATFKGSVSDDRIEGLTCV